jgi:chemotaxis protein methyltransferase CheR
MIEADDREFLAELCLARAGLQIDPGKAYLIDSRIAPVARREGFTSARAFVDALRADPDSRLAWAVVEALAQSETDFFRDRALFTCLVEEVLPELARARGGERVRVWSAACGAGQEIYSLAMLLADAPGPQIPVELYASDLSERALEKAQAGLYSQFEVQRGLPARTLVRHFEKEGESFALSPRIRQMVRWRRINLLDDLSRLGQFDLILCRNLLPQLAPPARARVLEQLRGVLAPGGRLVLGPNDPSGGLRHATSRRDIFAAPDEAARSAA